MEITEVRIKLMEVQGERLKAFCSVTFNSCFVVRDLKIIEGASGYFVAMPSRKLTANCPKCRMKNHLRASYCNQCGNQLSIDRVSQDHDGRAKLYADIAHPINSACREMIQERVVSEFEKEKDLANQPGYVSRYDDFDLDYDDTTDSSVGTPGEAKQRVDAPHGEQAPTAAPTQTPAGESSEGFGEGIL